MPQILEDLLGKAVQMGGFIFVVQIFAILFLCWLFRPTISRILEHLFGLPHTSDAESDAKTLKSVQNVEKTDSGHITVSVTNVNIHNPTNVQINHGNPNMDELPYKNIGTNGISLNSPTHHQYSLLNLRKHQKFLLGCCGVILLAWWIMGTQPENRQEATVESKYTQEIVPDSSTQDTSADDVSSTTTSPLEPQATETASQPTPASLPQAPIAQTITSKHLRGRGHSDGGREEPQYVGVVGYAAVYYNDLDYREGPHDTPWHIKTYEKDKQFWNEASEGLEHKTKVVVKQQWLEHKGYDNYDGYLEVERLSDGRRFYIDVGNFITEPYWTYGDVMSAIKIGKCFATYQQKSDYYPVNIDNKKVDLPDGTWVIVDGTTGTYGRGRPDNKTHQVTGLFWREDKQMYVGAFFNKDDLQFQY